MLCHIRAAGGLLLLLWLELSYAMYMPENTDLLLHGLTVKTHGGSPFDDTGENTQPKSTGENTQPNSKGGSQSQRNTGANTPNTPRPETGSRHSGGAFSNDISLSNSKQIEQLQQLQQLSTDDQNSSPARGHLVPNSLAGAHSNPKTPIREPLNANSPAHSIKNDEQHSQVHSTQPVKPHSTVFSSQPVEPEVEEGEIQPAYKFKQRYFTKARGEPGAMGDEWIQQFFRDVLPICNEEHQDNPEDPLTLEET